MKAAEIRDLETDELHGRIAELKEELFNLRFQLATGQLDNHRRLRTCKLDIARIKTVLRERDYAALGAISAEAAVEAAGGVGGSGGREAERSRRGDHGSPPTEEESS